LLNEECKIGDYPKIARNNSNLILCIYVANYLGRPGYFKVVYKLTTRETLPTNTTPSPESNLREWRLVLGDNENKTFLVSIPVYTLRGETRVTLVFELWLYDNPSKEWIYTGRWVHLYINITV